MPLMNILSNRNLNKPAFRMYKDYLFFEIGADVLVTSKNFDFITTLYEESQKSKDNSHGFAPIGRISFDIRNDSMRIKTFIVFEENDSEERVTEVNHSIYLPEDPSLVDFSSYRILGQDISNVPVVRPSRP